MTRHITEANLAAILSIIFRCFYRYGKWNVKPVQEVFVYIMANSALMKMNMQQNGCCKMFLTEPISLLLSQEKTLLCPCKKLLMHERIHALLPILRKRKCRTLLVKRR